MKDDQKNFLLFAVLAALLLFGWPMATQWLFPTANPPVTEVKGGKTEVVANPGADPAADSPAAIRDRKLVLAETPRVQIETPTVRGSINLKGARIDDLVLVKHKETIAKDSDPIRLLSPSGTQDAYFAGFGWSGTGLTAPAADAVWTASGDKLTPTTPVKLTSSNGTQRFIIELSVDEGYMFTVRQRVANLGDKPISVAGYGYLYRYGPGKDHDTWTIHAGPVASYNGVVDYGVNYDTVKDEGPKSFDSTGGWVGYTDIYWLTALVPDQGMKTALKFRPAGGTATQAQFEPATARQVGPGQMVTQTSRFFAGAKDINLLDDYEEKGGIHQFGKAIDWGWFEIFEKPIFHYLNWLFRMIGNFGVAIIALTLTVRLLLFPIAQKQFASMAQMRAVQPKMKAIQERYKDDKQRQQQEIMKLYKDEKVNPLAGCLPTLLQIPILYALYKVLMLSIEMRHQPFILWIKDLSAPDPLHILNLFGLLDFNPPAFLAIGVLPILLGLSMWAQFKLNPAPMDDVQKQVFAIMPWVLMFVMAPFAAGLQLYWITSNLLTIAQQKFLYMRHPALKEPVAASGAVIEAKPGPKSGKGKK
ncbi:membrane protein insertase YidC [Sphingomonas koreensis]|uniref:Membrane protein insertase YidC n=1 Tax=Sphingomonas koreensis TaxID=93064 RepID=A0A1L6JAI2_9SPHN|nr:membrane protein insertase YidC [Sphingomonas koreensis]APR52857.1 membrane protein insertase YidC [Sphingomonas koreensis]MDC7811199.1 membrane protein insertase YidC [Sphingomonas koreensis]PJI87550.1 YidC/Oxa1 family membrane protein insertase [Sphingomonas koreensis]RSU19367.1 membrane protein insertase YidC [Sphingomonas koreensis]RSU28313.1 membrane protein insertase YidC [Sphingomonas koreensis]